MEEKRRLINLKQFLILEGYGSTRLVEDYEESTRKMNPFDSREEKLSWKSESCLEFSHVNFLVFTHDGKCQGVSSELAYCRNSLSMIDRRWRCKVFDEIRNGLPATSFMDRGGPYSAFGGIERIKFNNDGDLHKLALDVADKLLYGLHPYLLWEAQT